MIAYVHFTRDTRGDREHADAVFTAENPRTRLRQQFEAELSQGLGERRFRVLSARFFEGEHRLCVEDTQEYVVEIQFDSHSPMIEDCYLIQEGDSVLQMFVLVLQNCYDTYGMAGQWNLLGAVHDDGTPASLEEIQKAVAEYERRTGYTPNQDIPKHIDVFDEAYTAHAS